MTVIIGIMGMFFQLSIAFLPEFFDARVGGFAILSELSPTNLTKKRFYFFARFE